MLSIASDRTNSEPYTGLAHPPCTVPDAGSLGFRPVDGCLGAHVLALLRCLFRSAQHKLAQAKPGAVDKKQDAARGGKPELERCNWLHAHSFPRAARSNQFLATPRLRQVPG